MQTKVHTRADVQWVISSVSLAVTLGLWGLFTSHEKSTAGVAGQVEMPAPQEQVIVPQPQALAPGQVLLFGGTAPQPQQPQQIVVSQPRHKGGGGGGGGGGAVTSTGSSKP
jgi:hypothetical protein